MLKRRKDVRRVPTSAFDVGAELAIMAFSVAVVYGFARLFADLSFLVPIATVAIASHVVAIAVRWAGGGLLASAAASLLGFAATAWLLFPPTTIPGDVPISLTTVRAYGTDVSLAWEQFQNVSAPAEVTAPFLLLIAIVIWTVAFLSDWAAFRLQSPVEALIPGFAVFVFGAFFATDEFRVVTTGVLVLAAMLAILFHRSSETARSGAWLGEGAAQRGQRSLLRVGAVILVATLVGGVSVAQALPGYDEPALENFDPTTWDEPEEPRVVLSPLVDIQSRLVDQPNVEVFRVQSPNRDYWRLTSLDVFDGQIWRSRGSFEGADGGLEGNLPDGTTVQTIEQTFEVGALAQIWLPAAYEPTQIVDAPADIELEYEAESGTLIVNRETENSDGLQYTLLSRVPLRDAAGVEAIRNASGDIPGDIAERYLELPEDFSPRVIELAETVVADAGAESPYDKALALQEFFRDPSLFTYSLDVQSGHGGSQIENFLFEVHAGYCEQFAGSFAAMARAIGLPSRVAVGFTPGEFDETTNEWVVTGKHAHAWPEVWLDGVGWLRFEPTPGRGGPGDEAYTGQEEAQEGSQTTSPAEQDEEDAGAAGGPTPPTTVDPNIAGPTPTTVPEVDPATAPAEVTTEVVGGTPASVVATVSRWLAILLFAVLVVMSPLLYGQWRASRARAAVTLDPRRRVGLAWTNSKSALQLLGVPVSGSDTAREVAARVSTENPGAALSLTTLAKTIDTATYSGSDIDSESAAEAERISQELTATARESHTTAQWWLRHMNPVNVWRDKVGAWGALTK